MSSSGTDEFWQLYHSLPPPIRIAAQKAFQKFSKHPAHPSLHLERLKLDGRACPCVSPGIIAPLPAVTRTTGFGFGLARMRNLTAVFPNNFSAKPWERIFYAPYSSPCVKINGATTCVSISWMRLCSCPQNRTAATGTQS